MMNNIKGFTVMYLVHSVWCIAFGVIAYMMYICTNPLIFCAIFPTMMFYALWFWYDKSERFIYRKMKVVRVIFP